MNMSENAFLQRLADRRRFGMKPGLDTIRALLQRLGDPQRELRCIHIAGTNGKGAVTAMLDSILRAAGYKVARYTSPHLVRLAERFFIDGAPAEDEDLERAAAKVFPAVEALERDAGSEVTFFECLTAVAFVMFAEKKVAVAIVETGLGGRLDATNVIVDPLVSVITRIGLDHCDWLGSTHAAIAEEKAGIIKPGRPVVCGAMPQAATETIERFASLNGCPFTAAPEHVTIECETPFSAVTARRNLPPIDFALFGSFQLENAAVALTVCDVLESECGFDIPDHAVKTGMENVVWPGRCQRVVSNGVTMIVDGAHNPDGAEALREALRKAKVPQPVGLVAGFCGDKDVLDHLRIMSGITSRGWAVPIRSSRSLSPEAVAERMLMAGFEKAEACATLAQALEAVRTWSFETGGTPVICGSLFLAGEALTELGAFPWRTDGPQANELTLH